MTDMYTDGRVEPSQNAATATFADASDHAAEVTHHAGHEVANVLDTTKQQARGLVDTARSRVADEADTATSRAADALSGTAKELADLASGEGSPDSQVAQLARQAGERVDRFATQLQERGYQGVTVDVTRWARAHPAAFLAAAAGTGFVIGRVFRAADTKGVVDAAAGSGSNDAASGASAPQLSAADPSLFAEERRADLDTSIPVATGTMPAPSVPATTPAPIGADRPIDLTQQTGPIAGV